ncbi:MAG: hypothetical protein JNM09_28965 [Blastocatellia bacterium]|nr:hypothetical protein [Blastocatellia bacterium]
MGHLKLAEIWQAFLVVNALGRLCYSDNLHRLVEAEDRAAELQEFIERSVLR